MILSLALMNWIEMEWVNSNVEIGEKIVAIVEQENNGAEKNKEDLLSYKNVNVMNIENSNVIDNINSEEKCIGEDIELLNQNKGKGKAKEILSNFIQI